MAQLDDDRAPRFDNPSTVAIGPADASGAPDVPGKFGCFTVAFVILGALLLILTILVLILSVVTDHFPPDFSRLSPANGQAIGPGNDGAIPPISDRLFSGGSAQAAVKGDLSINADLSTDKVRSYVQNGLSWIGFGTEGANDGSAEIVITFGEGDPGNSVAVTSGDRVAIGEDDQCQFSVHVTDTLVSGHVSCPSADVFNGTEVVGKVSIELDFSASS
jgi:hypothetical protein